MRTIRLVPALLLAGSMATIALADQPRSLKHVTVYVDGDRHVIPQFIDTCRKLGPEHGLEFHFVTNQKDPWDYRIDVWASRAPEILLSFMFDGSISVSKGNTFLFNFPSNREARGVGYKSVANALGKKFVEGMARYLGWYVASYSNGIVTASHEGVTYKARCVKHATNNAPDGDTVSNVCDAIADKLGRHIEDLGTQYSMVKTAGELHYSEPQVREIFEIISEAHD